jgi:hypothetical protein
MEKSPLAVPFHVAVWTKSVDRLIDEVDANPAAFCDRKSIIARELLVPVKKAVDHLAEIHPVLRCNGETDNAIEHLMARFDDLFDRVRVARDSRRG